VTNTKGKQPTAAENKERDAAVRAAYLKFGHNVSAISREVGLARPNVRARLQKLGLYGKALTSGSIKPPSKKVAALPKSNNKKKYILTSAQNNTPLFEAFWAGLKTLSAEIGAQILVSRFTYNKNAYGRMSVKPTTEETQDDLWYDPAIEPYLCDERLHLAPGLDWCGEMNILPTNPNPLSGLQSYTGRNSGIFPHAKIAMESVASGKFEATKFNYTTGACTQRNYIQKTAGQKAEFHHAYGALLVEVDASGNWFCRQLNADSTGTFYDLDARISGSSVTYGHRPEAINWGDIHVAEIDQGVKELAWGEGGMLDALKPKLQVKHDILDFMARSHWDERDPHKRFQLFKQGKDSVEQEVREMGEFLSWAKRPGIQTLTVDSNHHNHLARWLKEKNALHDPVNAHFWTKMQKRVYDSIDGNCGEPNYLEAALLEVKMHDALKDVRCLSEDESYVICESASDGIELGLHGDRGINGSRGTPRSFTRMGRKANTGHTHSAGIIDGVYTAGTCSLLTPDWVRGPSSWSHTHIITYPNGKRALVTMWNGKWRA